MIDRQKESAVTPEPEARSAQEPIETEEHATEVASSEAEGTPKEEEGETSSEPTAQDRVQQLEQSLREADDNWKRSLAQIQNERRRHQENVERVRRHEREDIFRGWLEVVDNLDRALATEGDHENPWYEGMKAIHAQMKDVLQRFGVTEIVAVGEMFDPEQHEAIATANLPDQKEGEIAEVVQVGYRIDDRTLRHAKVIPVKHATP